MKKRILALLLAAVMVMATVPAVFAADAAVSAATAAELLDAVGSGASAVKLTADIELHEQLWLENNIDLDLDGHTLTLVSDPNSTMETCEELDSYIFIPSDDVEATIRNGTVKGDAQFWSVLSLDHGTAHLEDLTVSGRGEGMTESSGVSMANGSVERCAIYGGFFPFGHITSIGESSFTNNAEYGMPLSVYDWTVVIDEITDCSFTRKTADLPLIYMAAGEIGAIKDSAFLVENGADNTGIFLEGGSIGSIDNCTFTMSGPGSLWGIQAFEGASIDSISGCTLDLNTTGDASAYSFAIAAKGGEIGSISGTSVSITGVNVCAITAGSAIGSINNCDIQAVASENAEDPYVQAIHMEGGEIGSISNVTAVGDLDAQGSYIDGESGDLVEFRNVIGKIVNSTFDGWINIIDAEVGDIRRNTAYAISVGSSTADAPTTVDKIIGNTAAALEIGGFWPEGDNPPVPSATVVGEVSGNKFVCPQDASDLYVAFVNSGTIELMADNEIKGPSEEDAADGLNMGIIKVLRAEGELVNEYENYGPSFVGEFIIEGSGWYYEATGEQVPLGIIESVEAPLPPVTFTDVPANAYYADAVAWAVENGVTNGATSTTFDPDGDCTRAQIVTFLWRACNKPEPKSTVSPFTDVTDPGAYYYKAVLWAVENGITNGATSTTFDPNGTCTRGQAVTFLWRAAEKPSASGGSAFTDVTDPGAYYYDAVRWAVENHITDGKTSTTFAPGETCTRGQIVTFLFRDLAE